MLSIRNSEIRTAWIVSGAIHLAVLLVALIIIFGHAPVETGNQIVYLVSSGKSDSAAGSQPHQVNQQISKPDNSPAIRQAESLTAAAPAKPAQAQSSAQGVPSIKKEQARAAVASGQGTIEAAFGDASGLNFRHRELPVYPQAARRMNREGRVLLRLTIDEGGRLTHLEVIQGAGFGFTEAATEAVRESTFIPARQNGIPVRSHATLSVKFELSEE